MRPEEIKEVACDENMIPVYFNHKIADNWSTCTDIYLEGKVKDTGKMCEEEKETSQPSEVQATETKFIDTITPPYKKLEGD